MATENAKKRAENQEKPSVMVDTLMFTIKEKLVSNYRKLPQKQLFVRLEVRGEQPCLNDWALPGRSILPNENLDSAALRGLSAELDPEGLYLEQLYTFGEVDRDERGRIISVAYLALISQQNAQQLEAINPDGHGRWFKVDYRPTDQRQYENENGDIELVQFYNLELQPEILADTKHFGSNSANGELFAKISVNNRISHHNLIRELELIETKGIAFDHARMIGYGLERLKNKVEYTDILFNLMPKTFTLSELQQVYELLIGEKVYTAQFRRKIEPKLIRLRDQVTEGKGHRPAQRYQYNPLWQLKTNLGRDISGNNAE